MAKKTAVKEVEFDKHALQEARAAARAKANEVFQKEMAAITQPLTDQIAKLESKGADLLAKVDENERELLRLQKALADCLGTEPPTKGTKGTKKGRRNIDDLKADAAKIVAFLEKNPGAFGKDIKATGADYGLNLKTFVQKYANRKVKSEGPRNSTTYALA